MNLERAQGAKARTEQRMKLFRYYFDSYNEREALNLKMREEILKRAHKSLALVKQAKTKFSLGEYLVAKHIFDRASDELGRAIDYMHESGGA